MITPLRGENLGLVRNRAFADYAETYEAIHRDFMAQIAATGIGVAEDDQLAERDAALARLRGTDVTFRNCGRSIALNAISPACVACRKGTGSATFFVSLKCHRDCYFCFNPNQVDYEYYQDHRRDPAQELADGAADGFDVEYLALTGGEPLVHRDESLAFFEAAREHFPTAHTRLYTTGDHASEALLARLRDSGLQEIRFSIRMHDLVRGQRYTLTRIALARQYIPKVMVEMPVMPGMLEPMKELLLELDGFGIHSINLLELCYPLSKPEEFNKRGFAVKRRPYETLYNYWYGGGLPVAGSELDCLELLAFGVERGLEMGVHYCSLENKLTGQNYQQNHGKDLPATHHFSRRDFLLKSAKVFGPDIPPVLDALRQVRCDRYTLSDEPRYLEFHVEDILTLAKLGVDVEVGLSTSTMEERDGETVLRELKIDLTTPSEFDPLRDV